MERRLQAETIAIVEQRLGRPPRGLRAIAVTGSDGLPAVIRVASLVDDKPFPTLYWLIDPGLCLRIDRDEGAGLIAALQLRVDADSELRSAMVDDHNRHIARRDSYLSSEDRETLTERGQWQALAGRGIGGIADFSRIRCLHTWYAAHLVEANAVGRLLDTHWGGE